MRRGYFILSLNILGLALMLIFPGASMANKLILCVQGRVDAATALLSPRGPEYQKGIIISGQSPQRFLGIAKLSPSSAQFRFISSEIDSIRSLDVCPEVSLQSISDLRTLAAGGLGHDSIQRGVLRSGGRNLNVIIKTTSSTNRDPRAALNEAKWYMILNKLGLCPEFFGVIRDENGSTAIVTEYIEGHAFPSAASAVLPDSFHILDSHIESVLATGRTLEEAGIRYTPDIQFILTRTGRAILIDPEFFSVNPPVRPPVDLPFNPIQNSRQIAEQLRVLQRRRHRPSHPIASPSLNVIVLPGGTQEEPVGGDIRIRAE